MSMSRKHYRLIAGAINEAITEYHKRNADMTTMERHHNPH